MGGTVKKMILHAGLNLQSRCFCRENSKYALDKIQIHPRLGLRAGHFFPGAGLGRASLVFKSGIGLPKLNLNSEKTSTERHCDKNVPVTKV